MRINRPILCSCAVLYATTRIKVMFFHCVAFDQRNPLRKFIVGVSHSSGHCKRYGPTLPISFPATRHVQAKATVDHVADWLDAASTIKGLKYQTELGESFRLPSR